MTIQELITVVALKIQVDKRTKLTDKQAAKLFKMNWRTFQNWRDGRSQPKMIEHFMNMLAELNDHDKLEVINTWKQQNDEKVIKSSDKR